MKINKAKWVCDRCGAYLELEANSLGFTPTPLGWNKLAVNGRSIDMCEDCSLELKTFLIDKGMSGIDMLFDETII